MGKSNSGQGLCSAAGYRVLGLDEIRDVAQGACFLASGGGGSLQLALTKIIPQFFGKETQISLAGVEQLGWSGDWGAVVAGMGSPLKMFEDPALVQSAIPAYEKLTELAFSFKAVGRERFGSLELMDFCLPVEIGAVNSLVPMIVANGIDTVVPAPFRLYVIDADGAGRAVPTLPLTTYARQLALYPNILGGNNNTEKGSDYFDYASLNVQDETTLETACLGLIDSEAFGDVSGLAIYAASGPEFQGCSPVPGGITDAQALGKIINTTAGSTRVSRVLSYITGTMGREAREIFHGTVTDMKEATSSLDNGYVEITGDGTFSGQSLRLIIQNENIWGELTAGGTTKPYIMGPDSMNYLTDNGDVVDNSDLWTLFDGKGEHPSLSIIGIKAPVQVLDNPGLITAWEAEVGQEKGPASYTSPWLAG